MKVNVAVVALWWCGDGGAVGLGFPKARKTENTQCVFDIFDTPTTHHAQSHNQTDYIKNTFITFQDYGVSGVGCDMVVESASLASSQSTYHTPPKKENTCEQYQTYCHDWYK